MRNLRLICAILFLPLTGACGSQGERGPTASNNRLAEGNDQEHQCWVGPAKDRQFVGTPECMRQLPQRRMKGVWVRGFESSIFFEGATRVPKWHDGMPEGKVWFATYPRDAMDRFGFKFDGSTHAFLIDFIGTKSDAPGVYGHFGVFRRGVLATRILTVREIPLRTEH